MRDACEFCQSPDRLAEIPNGENSDFDDIPVTICFSCWEDTGIQAGFSLAAPSLVCAECEWAVESLHKVEDRWICYECLPADARAKFDAAAAPYVKAEAEDGR